MKAVAAGNEVAFNGVQLAVFFVSDARLVAVELVHLHVLGFVHRRQACGLARVHQVAGHFGLAIDHDVLAAGELVHVNAVAGAVEQQVKAAVDQAFLVHALAHAGFVQQVHADLFQHTCTDAREHIVAALALDDDGVNAGFVQQLAQQQARGARADDGHLGPGGVGDGHEGSPMAFGLMDLSLVKKPRS